MWTRVIINRCIGKIIARDLSLVASRLYRMAITRLQSRAAITLSLSLGADHLGCINCTREKERKREERRNNHPTYAIVRTHKSHHRSLQLNGDLWADLAHGATAPPLVDGKNQCQRHLYRAVIQRSEEEKRETRKHRKVIPSPYPDFLTHPPNDHHSRISDPSG